MEDFLRLLREEMFGPSKVILTAKDVWDSWPLFLEEIYQGICPEQVSEVDQVMDEFVGWLLTQDRYRFHLTVGEMAATRWLCLVAEIVATRRIMEWKYILLTEYGQDTFASSEVRDEVVRRVRDGVVKIGRWE